MLFSSLTEPLFQLTYTERGYFISGGNVLAPAVFQSFPERDETGGGYGVVCSGGIRSVLLQIVEEEWPEYIRAGEPAGEKGE